MKLTLPLPLTLILASTILLCTLAASAQDYSPVMYQAYDSQHRMIGAVQLDGGVIVQVGHTEKEVLRSVVRQMAEYQQNAEYQCSVQKVEILKQWKENNDNISRNLQKNIDKFNGVKRSQP